jgi:tetraacyldisaccharide 4'-kinase
LYRAGLAFRRAVYAVGLIRSYRSQVPVISVGNITAGGTGKTPLVEWVLKVLPESLRNSGVVLTRGYGGEKGQNDETAQLSENMPEVKQLIGSNRVQNAKDAVRKHQARLLVLDDGFQHRRLARELDIVAIDALVPFGYGCLVPRGLLREPLSALRRANAFVITRSDRVDEATLKEIEEKLRLYNPDAVIAHARHAPTVLLVDGVEKEPRSLSQKKVFAFCGIGNPEGFRKTLEALGAEIVVFEALGDHEPYLQPVRERLSAASKESGAEMIVTTQKDAVKLRGFDWPLPLGELRVEIEVIKNENALRRTVLDIFGVEDSPVNSAGEPAKADSP